MKESSQSQLDSVLMSLLSDRSTQQQRQILSELLTTEPTQRDRDIQRQREKRSEAARIVIPECGNPKRRERCLADPERFLRTYFASRYRKSFDRDRTCIVETIWDLAQSRGRSAMAAPRGRGKTELVKGMIVAIVLAEFVRFPFIGAKTTGQALKIYKDIRNKFAHNDLLYEDFPEICHPVRQLEGAPQRAQKQHVDGRLTRIVWTANEHLCFPYVDGSPYGGVKLAFFGLDAAFRGANIEGDRPDFIVVDDPETDESAESLDQIEKREKIINEGIAGLAQECDDIAIAIFTTVQNRYCLSYKLTDPQQYPQFAGVRFGMIERFPDCVKSFEDLGLWDQYIRLRKTDQAAGDRHGSSAVAFYLENRQTMDEGAVMLSGEYTPRQVDGVDVVHSSLQVAFNRIADTNMDAYRTEYLNDPPPTEQQIESGLEFAHILACEGDYPRQVVDPTTTMIVRGVDVRKTELHFVTLSIDDSCRRRIIDYDVRSHGTSETTVEQAETAILEGLDRLATEWDEYRCRDHGGGEHSCDLTLIDKGWLGSWTEDGQTKTWCSQPVETFCMQRRGKLRRWLPAKGAPNYRSPEPSKTCIVGDNWHMNRGVGGERSCTEVIWNAEHWHSLVEETFLLPENDEDRFELFESTDGIWTNHKRFAEHIREGAQDLADLRRRGTRTRKPRYRRDHWWDSCAMMLVAVSIEQWFRSRPVPRRRTLKQMAEAARRVPGVGDR